MVSPVGLRYQQVLYLFTKKDGMPVRDLMRVVVYPVGRGADAELEIEDARGFFTPLRYDGNSGRVIVGERTRRVYNQ